MYDKVSDYFSLLGHAALDVSSQEKSACENIVNQATMVSDISYNKKVQRVKTDTALKHYIILFQSVKILNWLKRLWFVNIKLKKKTYYKLV